MRSSYSDFFTGSFVKLPEANSPISIAAGSFWISSCIFRVLLAQAITSTSSNTRVVVENSIFSGISVSSCSGGAVYFVSASSEIVFNRVCGFNMNTASVSGAFAFISTKSTGKCDFHESSFAFCAVSESANYGSLYLTNGQQDHSIINATNNNANTRSFIFADYAVQGNVKYSCIIGCKSQFALCEHWNYCSGNYSYTNIINNTGSSLFYQDRSHSTLRMYICVFIGNSDSLFQRAGGVMDVFDSYFDKTYISNGASLYNTKSISFTFTHKLFHTAECKGFSTQYFTEKIPKKLISLLPVFYIQIVE